MTIKTLFFYDTVKDVGFEFAVQSEYDEASQSADFYVSMSPLMRDEIYSRFEDFRVHNRGSVYPIKRCMKYLVTDNILLINLEITRDEWENWELPPSPLPKMCAAAGEVPNVEADRTPLGYISGEFDAVNLS